MRKFIGALFSFIFLPISVFANDGIMINFYSVGFGTNIEAIKKTNYALSECVKSGKINTYLKWHWGLEGETTLCVEFASSESKSVDNIEKLLEGEKFTTFNKLPEGKTCEEIKADSGHSS